MTMRGEKVYECDFDVMGVTDFGITLDAILSGKEKIPPQGARVDVAYAGTIKGRVSRSIRGVDYQVIRADGRLDLDTRATVETTDGRRIALSASGVGTPAQASRWPTYLRMCALSRLPWTTLGSTRVRSGPWAK